MTGILLYFFTDVSYAALMTESLLVYGCIACIISRVSGTNIEVFFEGEQKGEKGQEMYVDFHVKNRSRMPVFCACIFLAAENKLTGEKVDLQKGVLLLPMQKKTSSFFMKPEFCGCVKITCEKIEISDFFRLFVRSHSVRGEMVCYIFPEMTDIPFEEEKWNRYDAESYKYSSVQRGDDPSETFGIREYREGDYLKAIHWKLSGKAGELMVRELGLPIENSLIILMDKSYKKGRFFRQREKTD